MTAEQIEHALRLMFRDLQASRELSPQFDVAALALDGNLGAAGFDSVAIAALGALIDERLSVSLDDNAVSDETTLRDLIAAIAAARGPE